MGRGARRVLGSIMMLVGRSALLGLAIGLILGATALFAAAFEEMSARELVRHLLGVEPQPDRYEGWRGNENYVPVVGALCMLLFAGTVITASLEHLNARGIWRGRAMVWLGVATAVVGLFTIAEGVRWGDAAMRTSTPAWVAGSGQVDRALPEVTPHVRALQQRVERGGAAMGVALLGVPMGLRVQRMMQRAERRRFVRLLRARRKRRNAR